MTGRDGGGAHRIGYADLRARSRKASAVLQGFGVRRGDRVATLAWNTHAHIEVWYAIMGMGAVCHTLNPRLTAAQLAAMVVKSQARVLVVSADLLPLARQIAESAPSIERLAVIDGSAAPDAADAPSVCNLEPLIQQAKADIVWGGFEETAPSGLCFTSGATGAPKGVTYTHRAASCTRCACCRRT